MPFAEMWMDLEIIVTGEVSQKKILYNIAAFLVVQMVKNLPAMQETWIRSLGREDLLEKEMATHIYILRDTTYMYTCIKNLAQSFTEWCSLTNWYSLTKC